VIKLAKNRKQEKHDEEKREERSDVERKVRNK
jgi:hypothetical protein